VSRTITMETPSVLIAHRASGLPSIYVIMQLPLDNQIWIDAWEHGCDLRLISPTARREIHHDDPFAIEELASAAALVAQTRPFAQAVQAFVSELSEAIPAGQLKYGDGSISHINIEAWMRSSQVGIVLRVGGIISIDDRGDGRANLSRVGNIELPRDIADYQETIGTLLTTAGQIADDAETLSRRIPMPDSERHKADVDH
jgi:hypothetical protein